MYIPQNASHTSYKYSPTSRFILYLSSDCYWTSVVYSSSLLFIVSRFQVRNCFPLSQNFAFQIPPILLISATAISSKISYSSLVSFFPILLYFFPSFLQYHSIESMFDFIDFYLQMISDTSGSFVAKFYTYVCKPKFVQLFPPTILSRPLIILHSKGCLK